MHILSVQSGSRVWFRERVHLKACKFNLTRVFNFLFSWLSLTINHQAAPPNNYCREKVSQCMYCTFNLQKFTFLAQVQRCHSSPWKLFFHCFHKRSPASHVQWPSWHHQWKHPLNPRRQFWCNQSYTLLQWLSNCPIFWFQWIPHACQYMGLSIVKDSKRIQILVRFTCHYWNHGRKQHIPCCPMQNYVPSVHQTFFLLLTDGRNVHRGSNKTLYHILGHDCW